MKIINLLAVLLLTCITTNAQDPLIVAHRGASREAPENTIPAFELAWKQGADAIEGDFHLTKEGEIVCIHDGNTKKVSGKNLVVKKSTLAELKKLDVGLYRGKNFKGTTIPTIAEVFATIPEGKKIYIEIKCGADIIPSLLREIKKSNLKKEQIIIISFNESVIQKIKAKVPQYKANWLTSIKKNKSGKIVPSTATVLATLEQIKANGVSSSKNVLDENFIKSIKSKGYEYHVWTVNDAKTAKRFKKLGVGSITTDIPGHIKKHLIESNTEADTKKAPAN